MTQEHREQQDKWKTRAYTVWATVGACIIIWGILQIFGILWQAVATVVVTALISFMLHGIVNSLEKRGLPRVAGTAIAFVILLAIVGGLVGLLVPTMITQVSAFASNAPQYSNDIRNFITTNVRMLPIDDAIINDTLSQATTWIQQQAGSLLQTMAGGVVGGIIDFSNAMLVLFIALICSFWILIDLPKLSREILQLFTTEQRKDLRIVADAFSVAVYGWGKATLICAVITGIVNGIAFWILGMPYSALLGVLCGLLYFVPYIGPIIAAIVSGLIGLLVSPVIALVALIINTIVNNLIANILSPRLMKSSANIHPAIVMIVILIGGALGGAVGMLFSIPIAAAIQGVFVTFYEERTGKVLATEDGVLFQKPSTAKIPHIDVEEYTGKFHRIRKQ